MSKILKILFCIISMLLLVSVVSAQENIYEDIPKSRTEDGGFILGNPEADVKLIEFSDFLCPHCQDYKVNIDQFIEEFVVTGQAQFEYRMVPVVNANLSTYTANLVECADIQSEGLFWQAHDVMFDMMTNTGFTETTITSFAEQLGIDEAELTECGQTATQAQIDAQYAQSLGITGTPTIAVQYRDSEPLILALPQPQLFEAVVNANRPSVNEVVTVDSGRYTGIQTYRTEDGGFVLGDPDAPITIVAFEDFMCPHCQDYQPIMHSFIEQHVATGQAKFEYRFYPLVNPEFSTLTTQVAECVALEDLSRFWDAHDLLFEFANAGEIDPEIASVVAMLVGVDADAVNECIDTSIQSLVDIQLGQKARVTGTPGIRARNGNGPIEIIYAGQQAVERGAIPLEMLTALAEGSKDFTVGQPEISLLNDNFLDDDSLISTESCGIPCWQNIIPGETSLDEARTIIEEIEAVTIVQDTDAGIAFTVTESDICCQVLVESGTTTVNAIILQLAPNITLGQVIEMHGEPTFVSGEPYSSSEAIFTLFYVDLGTIMNVHVEGENGQLGDDSLIISSIYVEEGLMSSVVTQNPLDNWKGYLTYNEYMDGEFDNNP